MHIYIVWRHEEFVGRSLVKVFKRESVAAEYAKNLISKEDQVDIHYTVEYQEVA